MSVPQRVGASQVDVSRFCLLFIGHGSREAEANHHFEESIAAFRARYPQLSVYFAYIELALPLFGEVLNEIAPHFDHIRIVPLALFAAGHLKNDIPLAIDALRQRYPALRIELREAIGTSPLWVTALQKRMRAIPSEISEEDCALLVIGRGSSDAGANSAFFHMSRLIAEGLGVRQVYPAFVGITKPNYRDVFRTLSKVRPRHLLVIPYLFHSGVLHKRVQGDVEEFARRYPSIDLQMLPPLADLMDFPQILDDRALGNDEGQFSHLLPCHSCAYRVGLGKLQAEVGGFRSLLYSIRHVESRQQANNHPDGHAHAKIAKHIFICTNRDCADRGALRLSRRLRRSIKDENQSARCRVTLTSCMGRCGEGPAVAVYPDGIWYRNMDEEGIDRLVREHIKEDRLVAQYVDTIL